eukprot:4367313-Pyramimonas_sp.AAC.2
MQPSIDLGSRSVGKESGTMMAPARKRPRCACPKRPLPSHQATTSVFMACPSERPPARPPGVTTRARCENHSSEHITTSVRSSINVWHE